MKNCSIVSTNDSQKCLECQKGFFLLVKEIDHCLPIPKDLNCSIATYNNGIICEKCFSSNYLIIDPESD